MTNAPYLKQADSGVWYVHWTLNRVGKRISTRTTDQAKAAAFLSDWLVRNRNTDIGKSAARDLGVREVWARYKKGQFPAGNAGADFAWKNLDGFFAHFTASEVSQASIDCYVEERTSGKQGRAVQPQTAAKELSYLVAALNWCADPRRAIIPASCAARFDLPEKGDPRDRWLKTAEIVKLFAAARRLSKGDRLSRGERFLWLALETAGRVQALLDLTWDRVDFETGMISLNVPGRKKTKKRRAEVPMSKALRPILLRAYEERDGDLVLDTKAPIWTTLQHITIEAGLAPKQVLRSGKKPTATGISPHVLRHTAATHMARRGVSLFHIAKILGNSVSITERVYAKYAASDLQYAVDRISGD
jgi:integrase